MAALNQAVLHTEKTQGAVSRRELAKRLNISAGSLYAYLNGTTLPSSAALDGMLNEFQFDSAVAGRLATLRDRVEVARRTARPQRRDAAGGARVNDLPRDVSVLHGRDTELGSVGHALTADAGTPALCVVSGLAGVGKTALAIRAARTLDSQFPDGCLFIDLHGYAAGSALGAGEAASRLLRRLKFDSIGVPADSDDRTALLREQLSDKQALLVLDNALDAAQVRPLLPSSGRTAVLVTSRSNLNGLDDAVRVRVPPLPPQVAATLLEELVADLPSDRQPDQAVRASIAAACHGLPLALRIAAAVLRSEPWPTDTVDLEQFHDGDRDITAMLEYSVDRLPPELARTFTLLGLLPSGTVFDVEAAAAVAGIDTGTARQQLRRLVEVNLADAPSAGRYALHPLVHRLAERRARTSAPPEDLRQAAIRLVEHNLTSAGAPANDDPAVHARHQMRHALRLANAGRQDEALTVTQDAVTVYRRLATANPASHEPDLAMSLNNLGIRLSEVGRREDALAPAEEAVAVYRRLAAANPAAHEPDLATSLNNLGAWLSGVGRREDALVPAEEAVAVYRRLAAANPAAHEPSLAAALSNLGAWLSGVGRREDALVPAEEAVAVYRRLATANPAAYEPDLAWSLWVYASVCSGLGEHLVAAHTAAQEAVSKYRQLYTRYPEVFADDLAGARTTLADILDALGRHAEAAEYRLQTGQ
ncbi:tetratricopeptide repeat protein [Nocardia sp. alder85J]|uniref:tetratricopeptide repeat protein n=1 Tax=Nocardia sp. alder85J TaxID=2862949 RepID=UPI001CD80731|nr:tetratricopeptide repeat protein [Nocardia sp. alder85J]MCX4099235.1 tetratricopeptide repeat protein [Nocardia sp. alder85J]